MASGLGILRYHIPQIVVLVSSIFELHFCLMLCICLWNIHVYKLSPISTLNTQGCLTYNRIDSCFVCGRICFVWIPLNTHCYAEVLHYYLIFFLAPELPIWIFSITKGCMWWLVASRHSKKGSFQVLPVVVFKELASRSFLTPVRTVLCQVKQVRELNYMISFIYEIIREIIELLRYWSCVFSWGVFTLRC